MGWGAVGFFLVVAVGMWLFVMRLVAESRERLGRAYSMTADSSLVKNGSGVEVDLGDDPFRTVGQVSPDSKSD